MPDWFLLGRYRLAKRCENYVLKRRVPLWPSPPPLLLAGAWMIDGRVQSCAVRVRVSFFFFVVLELTFARPETIQPFAI